DELDTGVQISLAPEKLRQAIPLVFDEESPPVMRGARGPIELREVEGIAQQAIHIRLGYLSQRRMRAGAGGGQVHQEPESERQQCLCKHKQKNARLFDERQIPKALMHFLTESGSLGVPDREGRFA